MSPRIEGLTARFSPARAAFAGIFVVTLLGLLAVGATLPVLPRYVTGPIGGGDLEVGIVGGAFAVTGLACRPLAGRFADRRGRRPAVIIGALLSAVAGALYFVPAGVPGLIVARLFLGAGEGIVYTAGSAWIIDLAPPERRGQIIGWYGLAIWGGLSLGPPIGELLLHATSFEVVWAFTLGAPLLGALIATRIPEALDSRRRADPAAPGDLIERAALRPGLALALGSVGFATLAGFVVLHLDGRGIGHGTEAFTAFAVTVVAVRLLAGSLPDRIGAARCAVGACLVEALGLLAIALAQSLAVVILGALAMGAAFSLLFPSLALLVVERVPEERRGAAMGTFTAFFDLGVGVGSPLAGAVASLGGYGGAFALSAALGVAAAFAAAHAGQKRLAWASSSAA
jgi:MFS family permease